MNIPVLTAEQLEAAPKPRCPFCGADPMGAFFRPVDFPLAPDEFVMVTMFCNNTACRAPIQVILLQKEKKIITI